MDNGVIACNTLMLETDGGIHALDGFSGASLLERAEPKSTQMNRELTGDLVVLGYRLFLGREPESNAVIQQALSYGTLSAFRDALLNSEEFRGSLQREPLVVDGQPVPLALAMPPIDVEWDGGTADTDALLAHVQATWMRLGIERPHWSVLSSEQFMPEQIAAHEAAFFASGAADAEELVATIRRNRIDTQCLRRLLEFGCGVGRVTPHLAKAFPRVTACDVSANHLEIAKRIVAESEVNNVDFDLVDSTEFGMFGTFDVWLSRIVLQHNPPPIIAQILRRALGLLAPGGVAMFQVPTYVMGYHFQTAEYVRALPARGEIEMHVLPQPAVFQIAREAGCRPLEVREDASVGVKGWVSNTFVFTK
jgi:SAM-dependent methyltransferase